MGRQYNFYIDASLEKEVFEHLFETGYYLCSFCSNELVYYKNYDELCEHASTECMFFIYREDWGDFASKTNERIFREKSPIIVYRRPYINDIKNIITRGRFYIDTTYKDDIENFDLVCKEYNHLVRWLKKRIEYKNYDFQDGRECLCPITQKVIDLVLEGYSLRI